MATKKRLVKKHNKARFAAGIAAGAAVGAAAGAAAALLFAPKTGKKLRADIVKKTHDVRKRIEELDVDGRVREIFGNVTDETRSIYQTAQEGLIQRLADAKENVSEIDYKRYQNAVNDVIKVVKKRLVKESKKANMLKKDLLGKWKKLEGGMEKKAKNTFKKTAKAVTKTVGRVSQKAKSIQKKASKKTSSKKK